MNKKEDPSKIYIYYTCLLDEVLTKDNAVLYAYTTSKHLANAFEKTRNMKIFYKKVLDFDTKEYHRIKKKYPKAILSTKGLRTCVDGEKRIVEMCITDYEDERVFLSEDEILRYIASKTMDLKFLESKYLKILNDVDYFKFFKFECTRIMEQDYGRDDPFYDGIVTAEFMYEYDSGWEYDQLATLVYFFGKYFNK